MNNKWAFITGASSGIGKSFAEQLAQKGYHLVLLARRKERLEQLKKEVKISHPNLKVEVIVQDLTEDNCIQKIDLSLKALNIQIELLINNAGIAYFELFEKTTLEQKLATIHLNVIACTKLLHYFTGHMMDHKKQSYVCTIASLAGYIPVGNLGVYSATKAYLNSLSETLSTEFKNKSISFTSISPGGVSTEFSEKANQDVNQKAQSGMMTSDEVVRQSIKAIFNNKRRLIPGFLNKFSFLLFTVSPRSFAVDLAYKVMSKSVSKIK